MQVDLLWITAALLASPLLTLCEPLNVMSAPNMLRVGSVENVFVEAQDYNGGALQVRVVVKNHPQKNVELTSKSVSLNAENSYQSLVDIKIPENKDIFSEDPLEKQYVYLEAHFPTSVLEKVVLVSFQSGYIFIQTDKSIYTPQSTVQYRVFSVTPDLQPLDQSGIAIEVINPQGITIHRDTIFPQQGILTGKYDIPEVASPGIWSVATRYKNTPQKNFTAEFEVKEYVLPTFEVTLRPSKSFFYVDDDKLQVDITAKYLFGNKVDGSAFVVFGVMQGDSKTSLAASLRRISITEGEGKAELTRDMILKTFPNIQQLVKSSLYISVSVLTETGSEMVEAQRRGIQIVTSPYTIHFKRTPKFFKPGMPFDVMVYVTNPDQTPAENVDVVVTPGQVAGRTRSNGMEKLTVNTPGGAKSLQITVKTNDPGLTAERQDTKQMTAEAYATKGGSNNYLHIGADAAELTVGNILKVNLNFGKSPGVQNQDFTYLILSKGQIVQAQRFKRQGQTVVSLSVPVTKAMLPSFRVVAYYHVGANEVVADSVWVDVKHTCMGKLEVEAKEKKGAYEPGERFALKITGDPGARVGLVAVDKGVFVLNKNRLTQEKIWDIIEKHDTGCTAGSGRDSMGVFIDAGLLFESDKAGGTTSRTSQTCPTSPKRRRRAETVLQVTHTLTGKYSGELKKCCSDGLKKNRLGYTCERRATYITDGSECVKAFIHCCQEIQKLRQEEGEDEMLLARSEEDDDLYVTSDEIMSRTQFPESWLWEQREMPACAGGSCASTTLFMENNFMKDSITTWQILAISLSKTHGICVADPFEMIVRKDFFVDLKLPYSAVRNEQLEIKAILHNFSNKKHEKVRVEFTETEHICSSASKKGKFRTTVSIDAKSSRSISYIIIPMELGNHWIEVKAAAINSGHADGVRKPLKVVSEGVLTTVEETNVELNPSKVPGGVQVVHVKSEIPKGQIPNTPAHTYITVAGQEVSQTIEQAISGDFMGRLIVQPHGCGEQTMIYMTLPLIATHYLDTTKQWEGVGMHRRAEAIKHIQTGYQRELTYRKEEGSYAAWTNRPGSTWLTAYVAKVFAIANDLISIEPNVLCSALKWLVLTTQMPDGMFKESAPVIHGEMVGDVRGKDADASLTAFVLIAMQEGNELCAKLVPSLPESMRKATEYLDRRIPTMTNPYAIAMTSYAMANAGKFNRDLLMKFSSEEGSHWKVAGGHHFSLEATAYALLALVRAKDFEAAGKVVHWLNRQTSPYGSSGTTQATIMVFQSVAEYYKQVKKLQDADLDVEVAVSGRRRPSRWIFRRDSSHLTRSDKVQLKQEFNVTAKGSGVGSLKVLTLYYARPTEKENDCKLFDLTVTMVRQREATYRGAKESYELTITTAYRSQTRDATMSILDIGLLTGFVVDENDLTELTTGTDRYVQKFEMDKQLSERGSLILYLDKVTRNRNDPDKIVFRVHKITDVAMLQPAAVTVYEYYAPGERCVKFYHPLKKDGALNRLCNSQQGLCQCAEENCSLQKKQKINEKEREDRACEAGMDYVYKVKHVSSEKSPYSDYYTMRIEQVLKEGTDTGVEGQVRSFMGHANCRESFGFEEGKFYLIMGRSADLPRIDGRLQYILGEQTWIEYWPTREEGQLKEFEDKYVGLQTLTQNLVTFGSSCLRGAGQTVSVLEGGEDRAPEPSSPQPPEEVEPLMCLPDQAGSVVAPGEVVAQVNTQVPVAGDHFHRRPSDMQREVGEGSVDHRGNGIICGSVPPVGILVWVHSDVDGGFDVGHNQSFKAFSDYRRESYRPVVIQTCHCGALGDRDDGGGLQAGGNSCLGEGDIENVCQYLGDLISALPILGGEVSLDFQSICGFGPLNTCGQLSSSPPEFLSSSPSLSAASLKTCQSVQPKQSCSTASASLGHTILKPALTDIQKAPDSVGRRTTNHTRARRIGGTHGTQDGLEAGHVEGGVNVHQREKGKAVGNGVDPAKDLKWADVPRCQLAGSTMQGQILSREPNPLPRTIGRSWPLPPVRIALLSSDCRQEGPAGFLPGSPTICSIDRLLSPVLGTWTECIHTGTQKGDIPRDECQRVLLRPNQLVRPGSSDRPSMAAMGMGSLKGTSGRANFLARLTSKKFPAAPESKKGGRWISDNPGTSVALRNTPWARGRTIRSVSGLPSPDGRWHFSWQNRVQGTQNGGAQRPHSRGTCLCACGPCALAMAGECAPTAWVGHHYREALLTPEKSLRQEAGHEEPCHSVPFAYPRDNTGCRMQVDLLWITAALLASPLLTLCEPLNVMSAPNMLRVGSVENVFVEAQDYNGGALQVRVVVKNHPQKIVELTSKSVSLNAENSYQSLVDIKIPENKDIFSEDPLEKQYVYLEAHFPTSVLEKVVLVSFQSGYIFIQTDKSIYTPQSTVQYRVFSVTPDLQPLDQSGIAIEVINPQGITIHRDTIFPQQGILTGKYDIPEVVSPGIWSVATRFMNTPQKNFTAEFEVKEYVLPTFEVTLRPSKSFFYVDDDRLQLDITAKYLFGNKVTGSAFVVFGVMQGDSKTSLAASLRRISITEGEGKAELTRDMILKTFPNIQQLVGSSLYVSVSVLTETGSEMVEAQRRGIQIVTSPYTIHFKRTPKFFKPGMPFDVMVYVTNPDQTPAENVDVVVTPGEVAGRTRSNGMARLTVNTPGGAKSLQITVKTNDPGLTAERQDTKQMTAEAYATKGGSNNYLHIGADAAELTVGDILKVNLNFGKSPGVQNQDFTYLILSKGQIVQAQRFKRQGQSVVSLSVPVTKAMLPSFRLVAYYHVGANEVVADSVWVDVKDTCMGKLEVEAKEKKGAYEPGERFALKITGDPGARVGLVAVDKGVFVLNKNRLTQEKIWDIIEKHDTGCTAGSGRDSMGVFIDAGLLFESDKAGGTTSRTSQTCPTSPKRRRRAETVLQVTHTLTGKYSGELKKCCSDGLKKNRLGYTCERRATYITDGSECVKAFIHCCQEIQKLRQEEGEDEMLLARSEEDDDLYVTSDEITSRTQFPESWLWEQRVMPACAGGSCASTTLFMENNFMKDSITTWQILAISLSKTHGICVADPYEMIVRKDFFVDLKLPYSAVRNEQLEIKAILHNFSNKKHEKVRVEFTETEHICSSASKKGKFRTTVSIDAKSSRSISYIIIPMELGNHWIEVKAAAINSGHADGVRKPLKVVSEGVLTTVEEKNVELNPSKVPGGVQVVHVRSEIPNRQIPNTPAHTYISVAGQEVSQTIEQAISGNFMGRLIVQPYGCGEQVMIRMTLPLIATHYLDTTKQWEGVGMHRRAEAVKHIQTGYQRELTYRKEEGSYAAYRNRAGSTWLTAYVAKVFAIANDLISIEPNVLCSALRWLVLRTQMPDGMFKESAPVIQGEMVGDVRGKDADASLTAFVLIAMQEGSKLCAKLVPSLPESMTKATEYLDRRIPTMTNPYAIAMTSYAMANAGKFNRDLLMKFSSGEGSHWKAAGGHYFSLEATAYALLALVRAKDFEAAGKVVNWLNRQTSPYGSSGTTQATIMVFQAVAEYYKQVRKLQDADLDVEVAVSGRKRPSRWIFRRDSSHLTRSDKVQLKQEFSVTAKGSGVGSLKVLTLYYARPTEKENDCKLFDLTVTMVRQRDATYRGAKESYELTITTAYRSQTRDATMSILDIGLLTGFVVDENDLTELTTRTDRYVQKFEMDKQLSERGSLILYLDKVTRNRNNPDRVVFRVHKITDVAMLQPAAVTVYEYYDPGERCVKFYHPLKKDGALNRLCNSQQGLCQCAEENCSIQKKQKINEKERDEKACETGMDYVYKVKHLSSEKSPYSDYYTMRIEQVLKEGTDTGVEGQVRSFMGHANCRESFGFEEGKFYLIMGRSADLPRKDGRLQYILGEQTWIEYWPTREEGQLKEFEDKYVGLQTLILNLITFGCTT
ncbi:uncharacterized protein [Salminus brasiliensis]|uniref:uncharacterized protein n=1 Tax=Salminus brasiliensis TaxID=930266 RepID=UPI003B82D7B9